MSNYLLHYSDYSSIDELINSVNSSDGIPLKELKVMDLVFINGTPIYSSNGVYVFKNKERVYYVGNCVARNFVERIPAHFDIRRGGWFNTLLRNIIKDKYGKVERTDERLREAAEEAFNNINLVLINFPEYNRVLMNNVENQLGQALNPINKNFKNIVEMSL